ncbi:MAG: bifunctional hydroxymethylpyrimidine kinase/phosphomethylpyrimidine kinase [Mariprofundaceae bacterium]
MSEHSIPVALTIGGSDSCSGAGIQADLQTFSAFGIKGCSAITALTAQNPEKITRVEPVSLLQLEAEIRTVFDYYNVQAVKTGMLYDAERIQLIAALLKELHTEKPLIVDPVMVSSSGKRLLDESALSVLKQDLIPMASLLTPNIPEACILMGGEDEHDLSTRLSELFALPVLLKGGHMGADTLIDTLSIDGEKIVFPHKRQQWNQELAHGTGCRLASAIAAGVVLEDSLSVAVSKAITWLQTQKQTSY